PICVVNLYPPLIGAGRPGAGSSGLTVARLVRQQRDRRIQVLEDLRDRICARVRLAEVLILLRVVGDVAPQPPRLEVIVGAEEECLTANPIGGLLGDGSRIAG